MDNINNKWVLELKSSWDFSDEDYRINYRVHKDINWFYTQNTDGTSLSFSPLFTREIKTKYFNSDWSVGDSNSEVLEVTSLVQWDDSSSDKTHKVEIKIKLTNRVKGY